MEDRIPHRRSFPPGGSGFYTAPMSDADDTGLGRPLPFAEYDSRHYDTERVEDAYRDWAPFYADIDDRLDMDLFRASAWLRDHLPGARVLDQACGTGRVGRWLRGCGVGHLEGIDLTPEMLARAQASGSYDATHPGDYADTGLPASSFHGVVNSMALCHAADLGRWFAEAARLLVDDGWITLVDYHPFFMMRGVPTHFENPNTGKPMAIENHVHALSAYFNEGAAAGFELQEMKERFVDDAWIAETPNYGRHRGLPVTFLMTFVRKRG